MHAPAHNLATKLVSARPNPPSHYSSLGPFRDLFEQGNPILTYHKLGPRPRRVRVKGLYVSAALFDRQLAELRAAGVPSAAPRDFFRPGRQRGMVRPATCRTESGGIPERVAERLFRPGATAPECADLRRRLRECVAAR